MEHISNIQNISSDKGIKISVIIPIYNMEKYLGVCLDSVIGQTLQELEILCIDDGSSDRSLQILKSYAAKETRIVIINQQNCGVAIARNNGIERATGEFLYFLDADDWIPDANVLSDLYKGAKEHNVLICGGSFLEHGKEGVISKWSGDLKKYTFEKEEIVKFSEYQFDFGWVRFIYNRDFICNNDLKMPPYRYFEDPVFFVRAMDAATEFYCIKRYTYCYRKDHKSKDITHEQCVDLLKGLYDNMVFASKAGYSELLDLEKRRLENDYAKMVLKQLACEQHDDILIELERINQFLYNGTDRVEYRMVKTYDRELNEVYNSTTWKVGAFMLYMPKKIKIMMKKIMIRKWRN